ncbi:MAG: cytochrome c [Anaerolineae bacterium]|jgi:mono/diheme cytochrome c family protein
MGNSRHIWLVLVLSAVILLVGSCGAAQDGSATQGDASRGWRVWAQSECIGCHGLNAEGSTGGPALAHTPLTLREVINITRRGGPGMPAYTASQTSDQDLQNMYAWFQNPVPATTDESDQNPWAQWACAGCHGLNAEGATASALAGTSQSYSAFEAVVRQGTEGMPPFSEAQLSDQTLQAIYAWLQAQAPEPDATGEPEPNPWAQSACAGCHGLNAEGASASALAGTSQSYSTFEAVVRQGAEGMPPFSETQLSDQTLQAIYAWLQAQAQTQAPPPTGERAQALWTELACAGCHGANAEGAIAEGLTGEEFDYDEFQRVVREGEDGMPAYNSSQVSDSDLQLLYDWLTSLP